MNNRGRQIRYRWALAVGLSAAPVLAWAGAAGPAPVPADGAAPWWIWPIAVFALCFLIGIVAALGGIGGGVLFVPIASSFLPMHLDFIRGAGLIMALAGALAASPRLLRSGMANLRLTMPLSLAASASSVLGAYIGLRIPPSLAQGILGAAILAIAGLMAATRARATPRVAAPGALSSFLKMNGSYRDENTGTTVDWAVHRAGVGLLLFLGIGLVSGMFGLGAGWANVPALNLVMGAPLKVAAASSLVILAISNTSAAWVYMHEGAVLAILTVPAVLGIMLGTPIGARLLTRVPAATVRRVVIAVLFLAGARSLWRGVSACL